MLVDDVEGTVHHAYGMLPNMTYIVARRGMIHYRASWTDPDTLEMVLDHMGQAREQKRERKRIIPFYTEWYPERRVERGEFLAVLLETGGIQAVEEFISAIGEVRGPQEARTMHRWWDAHRP